MACADCPLTFGRSYQARTSDETKKMMRRLSKDNTKHYGRFLGKMTHTNPLVVFSTMLGQIQAYDNLIVPVVDMMKYITPMSFDVVAYTLLSQLASPSKAQLKDDGLNVSLWMQSLSSFCGNLYKKYPHIELVGLLQYVTQTLKSGQSLQLLLLRDLVTKMAGIDMLDDLSADQLQVPPPTPPAPARASARLRLCSTPPQPRRIPTLSLSASIAGSGGRRHASQLCDRRARHQ